MIGSCSRWPACWSRGTIVNIHAIASVTSDGDGKREITLRARPEKLEVSRTFAHLFKSS